MSKLWLTSITTALGTFFCVTDVITHHLNDWIYQLDESRLINQTEMTKWGFKVGQITLVIEKIK